jgi:uncharacterized protein (DUF4213/DUF364 family)
MIDQYLIHQFNATVNGEKLDSIVVGVNWILAQMHNQVGLCYSVRQIPRTLPWAGTLAGQPMVLLAQWLAHESLLERSIALAVINSCMNLSSSSYQASSRLEGQWPPHLRVFEYFQHQLAAQRVVVIGHYPLLSRYWQHVDYQCLELHPQEGDLSAEHSETVLRQADWVFITASSIANQSIDHLLQLSQHATVVLMGPSLPWLEADFWRRLGVNYLAGVKTEASPKLWHTVAEAGGTRIFENGVSYALLPL